MTQEYRRKSRATGRLVAKQAVVKDRRDKMAAMWNGGATFADLMKEFGWSLSRAQTELVRMRRLGYELEYRRPSYAAVPIDSGTWAERRSELARQRAGHQRRFPKALDYLRHDPCAYCGGPADTLDHIVARSNGGDDDWTNATACCRACNTGKYDRSVLRFMAGRALDADISRLQEQREAWKAAA
jgi:hypothetical protein